MNNKKDLFKGLLIMLVTVLVFTGAMFGLNFYTAPLIEANNAGAALAPLKAVMPDAEGFEALYDSTDPSTSSLKDVAAEVISVYKETSGKGFVFRVKATSQYSKDPMELSVGVTSDGKICGIKCDVYTESKPLLDSFLPSFIDKDSALAGVEVTGGVTYSSKAIKASVESGLNALIANGLITEGVKSDEQILTELIPSVHSGLASDGALKCDTVNGSGNIQVAYKGQNDSGFAYIMAKGDAKVLAVTNNLGACKVYDVEGNDVTEANADLAAEALAHTAANIKDYDEAFIKRVGSMMPGATNVNAVTLEAYNSVVSAVEFELDGAKYYAFYSKSHGFHIMDVYFIIDAEGKIVKMSASEFIFDEEYFGAFAGMPNNYQGGFEGLTSETFDGSQAIIATATMTSNAVKQSTYDSFAAFDVIKNGGAN